MKASPWGRETGLPGTRLPRLTQKGPENVSSTAAAQMLNYFNGPHPGKPGTGLPGPKKTARTFTWTLRALADPLAEAVSSDAHSGWCRTNSPPTGRSEGLTKPKPQGCRASGATAGTSGSRSWERLPPFLLRRAGGRGPGRWYTAVLSPAATASMVSSSREDMRYLGTRCTTEDGTVGGGPPQTSRGSLGTPSPRSCSDRHQAAGAPECPRGAGSGEAS